MFLIFDPTALNTASMAALDFDVVHFGCDLGYFLCAVEASLVIRTRLFKTACCISHVQSVEVLIEGSQSHLLVILADSMMLVRLDWVRE